MNGYLENATTTAGFVLLAIGVVATGGFVWSLRNVPREHLVKPRSYLDVMSAQLVFGSLVVALMTLGSGVWVFIN